MKDIDWINIMNRRRGTPMRCGHGTGIRDVNGAGSTDGGQVGTRNRDVGGAGSVNGGVVRELGVVSGARIGGTGDFSSSGGGIIDAYRRAAD